MTLEDFFTLTEMKDGLTAPARVKELVNVMQNERDCVVKNVGDATRQWSTVASTIAATEDKECLDLFVQLNGISFIDRWLKDAENCIGDTSQSFVEESMTALVCAVLKLNIDYEKAMSCGIWLTVKNLLDHSSTKVKDKARDLFDSWKEDGNRGTVPQDVEKVKEADTDMKQVDSDLAPGIEDSGSSLQKCDADKEKFVESAKVEIVPPSNSEVHQPESIVDVQMQASDKAETLDHEAMREDCTLGPVTPPVMSDPVTAGVSTREQSPGFQVDETIAIGSCTSPITDHGFEGKADAPESNELLRESEEEQTTNLPSKLGSMLISSVSTSVDPTCGSNDCAADAQKSVTGTELQNEKQNSSLKGSPGCDMDVVMPEEKIEKGDAGSPDNCQSTMVISNQSHHSGSDTSFSSEDSGTSSREKEHGSDETEDLENHSNLHKAEVRAEDRVLDKRSSFSELDFGMVDALEVARQVAIEVEREVTGCGDPSESSSERTSDIAPVVAIEVERKVTERGEASGSSSERTSGVAREVARQVAIDVVRKVTGRGEPSGCSSERISDIATRQPESAESVTVKEIQSIKATSKEVPPGLNLLSEATARRSELTSSLKDAESSQVTEAAQDPEATSGRGLGNLDLNQEISSEDMDHYLARRASKPIPVVSASRAAAAPRFPDAPLQFEGALGWRGSAATSAFRPTLAREKPPVMEESSSSSRQRDDCFDFDLNVAGTGDEPVNLVPGGNTNLVLSGLPFQDSSIQASSERSERLKLDLNLTSDDVDAPTDSMVAGRLVQCRNIHLNLSPSSSSSSMQPPALKNFDLNDQPSVYNDSVDAQSSRGKSSSQILNSDAGLRPSNSVISLMGTRVEVNRKDFVPYHSSFPNGNSAFDPRSGGVSGMGSAVQYGHPHLFGYNGLAVGPAVTIPSSMYGPAGPVQYMVDSRGVPVVPQLMGSASASLAAYPRPPFVMGMGMGMGMIGTPPGSNGPGLSQHNFDLSSGMMMDEGNRQSGGVLRQLLDPGQNRSVEEHSRVSTHSFLGPSGLGKRKEPEDGWEPYPQFRNHRQPPWN